MQKASEKTKTSRTTEPKRKLSRADAQSKLLALLDKLTVEDDDTRTFGDYEAAESTDIG